MSNDGQDTPLDATATASLESQGLRYAQIAASDPGFETWLHAVGRGFFDVHISDERIEKRRPYFVDRRLIGIWDDSVEDTETPVATTDTWIMDLFVPGGHSIPAWAISAVSVAPTHRRRGIARNLIEAELRTAVAAGLPMAMLTVSEATIYGRFGFAPSTMTADWTIDTKRVTWIGREPKGRLQLVTTESAREVSGYDVIERARATTPGEVGFDGILWERLFGDPASTDPSPTRVVRYDDEAGVPQGLAIYKAEREDGTISLDYLNAATDDAYAALWRYLLELDLVDTVKAKLRPTDEPFRWQISDFRAATQDHVHEHLWLRILDVKTVLEARAYSAPGSFVLELTDPLGYADGAWQLSIDGSGTGTVEKLDDSEGPTDSHVLQLSVNDLAAAYLGGTSFGTLVRAGLVNVNTPAAAAAADAAFRSAVTPWLSIWF